MGLLANDMAVYSGLSAEKRLYREYRAFLQVMWLRFTTSDDLAPTRHMTSSGVTRQGRRGGSSGARPGPTATRATVGGLKAVWIRRPYILVCSRKRESIP